MATETAAPSAQILIVDDEVEHAEVMAEALHRLGHVCTIVHDRPSAERELKHGSFDLVVTDLVMEHEDDGLKVLDSVRRLQTNAETIVVTAHGDVPTSVQAVKAGAFYFIEKPLQLEVFRALCQQAIQRVASRSTIDELHQRLDDRYGFEGIIGTSPAIRQVIDLVRQVAASNIPVLILGASGTGKELVANAVHHSSKRAKRRFVPLNCAGLTESILEDELFGHVKGAFTGAERDREGRFEYADGGTLFLDEVGDMPLVMQAKLLRVLESGEVVRVGSNEPRHVDVRLISATNQDLDELVRAGRFRGDLFFRIKGVELRLPPLRDRREDVPLLVQHYVRRFALRSELPVPLLSEDTQHALLTYSWPGNVRELMNVVQNMVVIANGQTIEPRHLPPEVRQGADAEPQSTLKVSAGLSLTQMEKQMIRDTLRMCAGNREQAARMLGIGERTLYRKLKEYGLK